MVVTLHCLADVCLIPVRYQPRLFQIFLSCLYFFVPLLTSMALAFPPLSFPSPSFPPPPPTAVMFADWKRSPMLANIFSGTRSRSVTRPTITYQQRATSWALSWRRASPETRCTRSAGRSTRILRRDCPRAARLPSRSELPRYRRPQTFNKRIVSSALWWGVGRARRHVTPEPPCLGL